MDEIPKHPILQFPPGILKATRGKHYFHSLDDMNKAIDILDDWLQKQDHMTKKDYPRDYLERAIINEKGSVEKTKTAIDKLCTIRTLLPRFFEIHDAREIYKIIHRHFNQVLLPKLTKENWRVYIPQIVSNGFTSEILFSALQLCVLYCEFVKSVDYNEGIVVISDFSDIDIINGIRALNLVDVRQIITIIMEGFHIRVKAIHIITQSTKIDLLLSILNPMLKNKIMGRFHVHKSMESLHNFVSKEILPSDFGGEEKSLKEMFADWIDVLSSNRSLALFEEIRKFKTDEKYRATVKFNEEYMGMAGTFRTFTVD